MRREVLGREHPATVAVTSNFAVRGTIKVNMWRLNLMQMQVLGLRKEHIGVEKPEKISATANLTRTWRNMEGWNEHEDGCEVE